MTAQKTRMLTVMEVEAIRASTTLVSYCSTTWHYNPEDCKLAQELVQLRVKVDKTLPTKGTKEFRPSNSWLEKKQIQAALDERRALLEEERVERLGALTRAVWDPELKIANVTCRVGRHWKHMGHEVGGKLYLFPEEALFLLETTCLELMHNGVAMSIQEGYSMLLGPDTGCTFNEYQTYVHLVRQGYSVLRHSKSIRATRYERKIRLHQHSVGQKQHKMKEDASVQEIVIEDSKIDAKEPTGVVKPLLRSEDMPSYMKIEQEVIDVETTESVDMNNDRAPDKAITEISGTSETSGIIEKSLTRKSSSESDSINSNLVEFQMTEKIVPVWKGISTVSEHQGGEEALQNVKDEMSVQEKSSWIQTGLGSNSNHGVNSPNCKSDSQIMAPMPDSRSGENEEDVLEPDKESRPELQKSKSCKREAISGITAESCSMESMMTSSSEESDSGICSQDGQSSKETSSANESPLSHKNTLSKCSNSTSELVKAVELTWEMADVTVVDDICTSVSGGQEGKSSEDQNKTKPQQVGHEGDNKQKQLAEEQNVIQAPEKGIADCTDIVDVSDSSQTSHPELKIESSVKMRRCGIQNKTVSENNDEIEIVSIVDVKSDADNEIIEVNHQEIPSTSGFRSMSRSRQRKSYQNSVESNAVKNEIQSLQRNTAAVKPDVVDIESDAVASVTWLSSRQISNVGCSKRQVSNDTTYLGRGKVTNIHLKHDEIEIMPSFIDISEEEGKQNSSYLKWEETNSMFRTEIEVVDLEDEDIRPELSWEEERMKILDSIPSIDGKFIIHVRVPDKNLLPPNVCPQKKDYYIQKCRLNAPGIGGKLVADLPNYRTHRWKDGQPLQTDGQINPWIQDPICNLGGGGGGNMFGAAGVWSSSPFPMSDPFMNQHYQTPFPGPFGLQTLFHQAVAMLSVLGNPAWEHNRMFGMPALAPASHHSRIPYDHRPLWHYQTRPYYRRPYYKRGRQRFETQYHNTPVRQHFENETNCSSDIIPLKVEDKVRERVPETPPEDDNNDVIECGYVSAVKVENEGQRHDSSKNGIDRYNGGRRQKRKGSRNTRFFEPPKKLRAFIEKLRLETKDEKRRKDILKDEVEIEDSQQEVLQQKDIAVADVNSWRDLKTVMQVVDLDFSSEDEDDVHIIVDDIQEPEIEINEPLVQPEDYKDIGLILNKLQIIKPANFEQETQAGENERVKISFDLYLPTATFRKASPGLPNYRITVVGYEDPMPEPKEVVGLLKDFQDDVPLLFAIVLPNTVTFLQFGSIKLPVETFCP